MPISHICLPSAITLTTAAKVQVYWTK